MASAALRIEHVLQIAMPLQEFPLGEGKAQPTVVPAESAGAQNYRTWLEGSLEALTQTSNQCRIVGSIRLDQLWLFFIQVLNRSKDGNPTCSLVTFSSVTLGLVKLQFVAAVPHSKSKQIAKEFG